MTNCLARGVHHEISDGHFAGGDKGPQTCQKPKCNHQAADQFDDSADQHQTLRAAVPAGRALPHAAFFAGCLCFLRDFAVVFFFAPVSSRLLCRTETRSITFVGLGAFFGFSSISFPPASTFSSITSMSASR